MAGFGPRRAGLIAGAVLLVGVALTGFAGQHDVEATRAGVPAPFELPGYRFVGRVDLAPYASDQLSIFPQDLALGADGMLYVGDGATLRLLALNRDGSLAFEAQIGEPPDAADIAEYYSIYERLGSDWSKLAPVFDGRFGLAASSDGAYIASVAIGNRAHRLATDGQIVTTWQTPIDIESGLFRAELLAVGDDGNAYYSERSSCGLGVLRPSGVAEILGTLDECHQGIEDIAVSGGYLYIAAPTEDGQAILVPVYDLTGQLVEDVIVRGAPELPEVAAIIPTRMRVDREGNLLILTTTILGRDDDGLLTEIHLLTVSPTGKVLATSELPGTNSWIDMDIAPDGTLGILYRDSTEVLLFEPVSR